MLRLHIGSGPVRLPGWTNVDNQKYPGVDHVLDVTRSMPWKRGEAELIFAEHFIEHLSYDDGLRFLRECRRILRPDGILRLSTPNLDWVWHMQYHPGQWSDPSEAVRDAFWMNKAFRGWGHQFLYNLPALEATLRAAGFAEVAPTKYGESQHEALRGLESHEQYVDTPELPHVVVVEAFGAAAETMSAALATAKADYDSAINVK
ncbi:MAG TPA: methyltransferase domain-containing protein [Thermoanaerobaculia bacterium]|nr:methyltransferase domain-containing protein [Thermoanaerobaculia bacterium]